MHRRPFNPLLLALVAGMVIGLLVPDTRWGDGLMLVLLVVMLACYLWRAKARR